MARSTVSKTTAPAPANAVAARKNVDLAISAITKQFGEGSIMRLGDNHKMKVETMTRSVFFKQASSGGANNTPAFSFLLVGWGAGTGESSSPLKSLLATYDKTRGMGASNRGRYSNPKMDKLLEQALTTVDDTKRAALLAEATEVAINDVGVIPLHYQVNTWAAKKGISYKARTDERTVAMMVE